MRIGTANPAPPIPSGRLLIQLDDITLGLGDSRFFAHTTWTIETGQHWAIIGPNGAGKSLLASALCRQLNLTAGRILFFFGTTPRSYAERGEIVCIGPQDQADLTPDSYHQARWNSIEGDHSPTVADLLTGESIEFISAYQVGPTRIPPEVYRQRRDRAVDQLGIRHLLDRKVLHLSNGEGRKLLLARALMQAPGLLILDDPFGGLDAASRAMLSQAIDELLTATPPQLLLLTARSEEIPSGITHLLCVDHCQVAAQGERRDLVEAPRLRRFFLPPYGNDPCLDNSPDLHPDRCTKVHDNYSENSPDFHHDGGPAGHDNSYGSAQRPTTGGSSCSLEEDQQTSAFPAAVPASCTFPLASRPADHRVLVEIQNTSIAYGGVQVLRQIDWTVRQGERWALLGPNGAGKSTLLSLILGDNPQAYHNRIHLFGRRRGSGESIWEVKSRIGWVAPELQRHYPRATLGRHAVCSGFFDSIGLYKSCTAAQRDLAAQWLAALDIAPLAERPFGSLSLGEQRLVLLARALVKDPDLLILDEPCQGLDIPHTRRLVDLLDQLCLQTPLTLVYVTHHPEELPQAITHLLRLDQGRVQACGRRADC